LFEMIYCSLAMYPLLMLRFSLPTVASSHANNELVEVWQIPVWIHKDVKKMDKYNFLSIRYKCKKYVKKVNIVKISYKNIFKFILTVWHLYVYEK
jgi:hypothetical protein